MEQQQFRLGFNQGVFVGKVSEQDISAQNTCHVTPNTLSRDQQNFKVYGNLALTVVNSLHQQ